MRRHIKAEGPRYVKVLVRILWEARVETVSLAVPKDLQEEAQEKVCAWAIEEAQRIFRKRFGYEDPEVQQVLEDPEAASLQPFNIWDYPVDTLVLTEGEEEPRW